MFVKNGVIVERDNKVKLNEFYIVDQKHIRKLKDLNLLLQRLQDSNFFVDFILMIKKINKHQYLFNLSLDLEPNMYNITYEGQIVKDKIKNKVIQASPRNSLYYDDDIQDMNINKVKCSYCGQHIKGNVAKVFMNNNISQSMYIEPKCLEDFKQRVNDDKLVHSIVKVILRMPVYHIDRTEALITLQKGIVKN